MSSPAHGPFDRHSDPSPINSANAAVVEYFDAARQYASTPRMSRAEAGLARMVGGGIFRTVQKVTSLLLVGLVLAFGVLVAKAGFEQGEARDAKSVSSVLNDRAIDDQTVLNSANSQLTADRNSGDPALVTADQQAVKFLEQARDQARDLASQENTVAASKRLAAKQDGTLAVTTVMLGALLGYFRGRNRKNVQQVARYEEVLATREVAVDKVLAATADRETLSSLSEMDMRRAADHVRTLAINVADVTFPAGGVKAEQNYSGVAAVLNDGPTL